MTTKQDAMEAAARAIENGSAEDWDAMPLIHKQVFRAHAKNAVTAYLAAREAEGFYMLHMSEFMPADVQAAIMNHKLKQSLAARPTNGDS